MCSITSWGPPQDSDRFWRVTPPARQSIARMLNSSAATLALSWEILRSAPLATKNGGPLCQGVQEVPLSAASSQDILDVLQVMSPGNALLAMLLCDHS